MATTDNSFWYNTFQEHGGAILSFLRSRLGRRDLAEDLLQETFLRAMRSPTVDRDRGAIRTYLFTTAYHLVVDHSRRKRPVLFSEFDDDAAPETLGPRSLPPQEDAAELARFGERLHDLLATLPAAHRVAFRSAVLEQKTYAEVATEQGWTLEQVKTNVYRARKAVVRGLEARR